MMEELLEELMDLKYFCNNETYSYYWRKFGKH